MIGWTNMVGGGVNIQNGKAVIHVIASTGSSVSFTKDGIIAEVLGPDKSYVRANNNMIADWYYSINSRNYGEWTVTVTFGTETISDIVTINDNKQYDLAPTTLFYIYNQGNTYDNKTGGYTQSHGTGSIAAFETDYINIYQVASIGRGLLLTTNNTFDMSQFKALFVEYTHSGELGQYAKFGVILSQNYTDYNTFTIGTNFTTQNDKTIGSVDLSSINSSLRVGFYDGIGGCKIYRVWFEYV